MRKKICNNDKFKFITYFYRYSIFYATGILMRMRGGIIWNCFYFKYSDILCIKIPVSLPMCLYKTTYVYFIQNYKYSEKLQQQQQHRFIDIQGTLIGKSLYVWTSWTGIQRKFLLCEEILVSRFLYTLFICLIRVAQRKMASFFFNL